MHRWDQVARAFIDARPEHADVVEELAFIENLGGRKIFTPFTLAKPYGVLPADINRAAGAGSGMAPGALRAASS